jgi:hypothetical protein
MLRQSNEPGLMSTLMMPTTILFSQQRQVCIFHSIVFSTTSSRVCRFGEHDYCQFLNTLMSRMRQGPLRVFNSMIAFQVTTSYIKSAHLSPMGTSHAFIGTRALRWYAVVLLQQ